MLYSTMAMFWLMILLWSIQSKLSILSLIMNMEVLMSMIFLFFFFTKNSMILILFMIMMVSEAVVGLVFCMSWVSINSNLKSTKINLLKFSF